jgi:hypothetical protein
MIAASLLCCVPSVLLDGSPVSPPDRFAATIQRHGVTLLKAGSTFLRMLMTMQGGEEALKKHEVSSVRLGTFCAEPVNEAVHAFAMKHVTPNYINSYCAPRFWVFWRGICLSSPTLPFATANPLRFTHPLSRPLSSTVHCPLPTASLPHCLTAPLPHCLTASMPTLPTA